MSKLSDEILNDPLNKGYDTFRPCCPGKIVDILNAYTETKVKSRIITARGILSGYPGGPMEAGVILDKLQSAAPSIPALKWAFIFITGDGLDIGDPATQGMLDVLASQGVLTQAEADNLKSLALQPASRAEVLGLPVVTEAMVRGI